MMYYVTHNKLFFSLKQHIGNDDAHSFGGKEILFFDFLKHRCYNVFMERNVSNLVLIGMPASGKSTVGVLAAKTLGLGFIDGDLMIQAHEKCLLSQLIERVGIDGFIAIENEINASVCAERCVISPGGSVIYGEEAMAHLREIGYVVYLRLSYEEIARRLGDIILDRGVIIRRGKSLADLYDERVPLYEKYADCVLDCDGNGIEETVHAVCSVAKGHLWLL